MEAIREDKVFIMTLVVSAIFHACILVFAEVHVSNTTFQNEIKVSYLKLLDNVKLDLPKITKNKITMQEKVYVPISEAYSGLTEKYANSPFEHVQNLSEDEIPILPAAQNIPVPEHAVPTLTHASTEEQPPTAISANIHPIDLQRSSGGIREVGAGFPENTPAPSTISLPQMDRGNDVKNIRGSEPTPAEYFEYRDLVGKILKSKAETVFQRGTYNNGSISFKINILRNGKVLIKELESSGKDIEEMLREILSGTRLPEIPTLLGEEVPLAYRFRFVIK